MRGFDRAQEHYDNMMPPDPPEPPECGCDGDDYCLVCATPDQLAIMQEDHELNRADDW